MLKSQTATLQNRVAVFILCYQMGITLGVIDRRRCHIGIGLRRFAYALRGKNQ